MFRKDGFVRTVYFAFGGTGSGESAADPKAIGDVDAWSIPAGCVIEDVAVVVTTALTGTTQLDVGDDDDPNGFVAAATLTVNAVTCSNGAYLLSGGNNLQKYYAAAGKEVKIDNTTANTAGAFALVVRGYFV